MQTGVEKADRPEAEVDSNVEETQVDKDTAPKLERLIGRPGQAGSEGFDPVPGDGTEPAMPERERRRWPASEASRMVVEAAVEAANLEQERQRQSEKNRQSRIRWAMDQDELPAIGEDFLGANLVNDEWVEVFREDLVQAQQRQRQ